MLNESGKKIEKVVKAGSTFESLVKLLGYNDSPNFAYLQGDEDYDAEYTIEIEGKKYPIIGLKELQNDDEEVIAKQHLRYWNRNDIPFSILILPQEIRVYNNFTIEKGKLLYRTGERKATVLEMFSNYNILNGMLWEKYNSILKKGDRVDKYLLQNMRNTIINLHRNHAMRLEDAYNLLAQCIFVKYLEDRKMLTPKAFVEYGVDSFIELLCVGNAEYVKSLFAKLKNWFNGDLFDVDNIIVPTIAQLRVIKSFFDADEIYANGMVQLTLYKYDFSKIPIELISNIYETFFNLEDNLTDGSYSSENGAYYTPYFLADAMNDWSLKDVDASKCPVVMDPACGSGYSWWGHLRRL